MSVFEGFTDRMSNIFNIVQYGYQYGYMRYRMNCKEEPISLFHLCGNSRYVLNERQFECCVGDKRTWIKYNQIFDVDIHSINDFLELVALGGDFDKSLPMTDQEEEEDDFNQNLWTNIQSSPKYLKYWHIVSSHIEQNILSHTRPECHLAVRCVPVDEDPTIVPVDEDPVVFKKFQKELQKAQTFRIELYIKSINNDMCYWTDINSMLRHYGRLSKMNSDELNRLIETPVIIYKLTISKNE